LPEIAVLAGTAHSALAAEICAGRGVRCAARPGQQRHCLAVLPGRGVEQGEPSTMSPGSTRPGQRRGRPAGRPEWWCTSYR
jgi:hypothetical protein